MTVLSDRTLRDRISNNELIPDGNPNSAKHCSYEFTAGAIVKGGSSEFKTITEPETISPAQLVWIKVRERISIPPDMVGLWIQTQTLARKGLLLLNISLIEPGYEGHLSAVFVNFGKNNVIIGPTTSIAKVVFMQLDGEAVDKVDSAGFVDYDGWLIEMASNAPASFLQLASFLPNLEEQTKAKLEAIDAHLKWRSDSIEKEVAQQVELEGTKVRNEIETELRSGLKGFVTRWSLGLLAGFFVGGGVVWFAVSSFLPQMIASYSKVDALVEKAILVHDAKREDALSKRVATQEDEIKTLSKQLSDLQGNGNKSQLPPGSSKSTKQND